jgi:hypothetical protein
MKIFTKKLSLLLSLLTALWLWSVPTFVSAAVVVTSSMTQENTAQPGEIYQGVIELKNNAKVSAAAKVYQTDYSFSADGRSNSFGEAGKMKRSNANWLQLSQGQFTVPPQSALKVNYQIRVPDDATLTGSYWSMLMVEQVPDPMVKNSEASAQMTQKMRYAVQVITQIGTTGTGELAFIEPKVLKNNGNPLFTVDIKNTGERLLRPTISLELYNQQGTSLSKLEGSKFLLYHNTSRRFNINLKDVPSGKYTGLVVADAGGNDLFGAQMEILIP